MDQYNCNILLSKLLELPKMVSNERLYSDRGLGWDPHRENLKVGGVCRIRACGPIRGGFWARVEASGRTRGDPPHQDSGNITDSRLPLIFLICYWGLINSPDGIFLESDLPTHKLRAHTVPSQREALISSNFVPFRVKILLFISILFIKFKFMNIKE